MALDANNPPEVALTLALAMVAASQAPLVLLDGDLAVIAASSSFCRAYRIDPAEVTGVPIRAVGAGEWNIPRLASLLSATVAGKADIGAYELDFEGADGKRRLILNAHKLDYADATSVRLLLTVTDVTDARLSENLKDDLIKDKAMLLQELEHRVANSLQIIASVLLQTARKVQSEETRLHLHAAHNRVLSIATVQKQLAMPRDGEVSMRPYLVDLCKSLGASMIPDENEMSLDVHSDASSVGAEVSVSLGLIVTELVINALKHAFPNGRRGKINIDFRSQGADWTLSVQDDGVGMPKNPHEARAGLGTSIVEALAKRLKATINIRETTPGTNVSVLHAEISTIGVGTPAEPRAL